MRILLFIALTSIFAGSCGGDKKARVPYYNDATFTPSWDPDARELSRLHTIASFNFINQYRKKVSNRTLSGKVYLTDFFFTSCPSICPKLTNTMKLVFDHFKGNSKVLFLSHSVTPRIDSVPRLYAYARKNNILSPQWHFITGDEKEIYEIARKSYFIEEELGLSKSSNQFLHTENFVLIDGKGFIRGIYNGTLEAEVPRIIEDIEALL